MQNDYVQQGYQILAPDQAVTGILYSSLPDPAVHFKSGDRMVITLDIPQHIRQEK
jgi:hypothetical protein